MDICPICLDEIQSDHIVKKLSCNHNLHFCCFKKLVYHTGNFFINCPVCRNMNSNIDFPLKDDYKRNILLMCNGGVGNLLCSCTNKNGKKCKKKSHLMNYGKCHFHHKEILPKEKYELFSKYFYHILCTNYQWISILYLLDFGKKVIIHFDVSGVEEILFYLYKYIHEKGKSEGYYMNQIFGYYGFKEPPQKWLEYCKNRKTII